MTTAPANLHAHQDHGHTILPTREVMDHEYDGIQEYDNPTPGWWHLLFLGTVAFSIPYFIYYETNQDAPTMVEAYQADKAEQLARQFAQLGTLQADEPTLVRMMGPENRKWMDVARTLFTVNCQQCHGAAGQGVIGPNMTDDHYKNVKTLGDIPKVIASGAAGGAMPPWRGKLNDNQIILLSAYVASLRGQNLQSTRPAEGEVIPPWPTK
jgi:cytochrome c oxidase cbb3-type subunit 3